MNLKKKGKKTVKNSYRRIKQRRAAGETDNSGFTLIELLIVIVVLGILAGVVVFALGGVTGQSAVAACKADGTTVETAIAAFQTDNPGLTLASTGDLTTSSVETTDGVTGGPFLQSWPSNDSHYSFSIDKTTGALDFNLPGGAPAAYAAATSCATVS